MRVSDKPRVRSEVVARVVGMALQAASGRGRPASEIINETLYFERERLRESGSTPRDSEDRAFYGKTRRELPNAGESRQRAMLQAIVQRYVEEICGHFDQRVYSAATKAVPIALTGLLNGLSAPRLLGGVDNLKRLGDHLIIDGHLDTLRRMQELGTVVLAPTHSSNLDSVILGYAIEQMGLPPAIYGAGLNLFSNPIVGWFMHHLGAYTVDRLKRDPLYKRTLKEFATYALELGYPALFFPGGTRSRGGFVEDRLKLGLLGTTVAAYANNLRVSKPGGRVFIFPMTLSYPLVLEGATLIHDHLRREGRSRYIIVDDEFSRWQRWLAFAGGLFNLDQRIYIRVARPLDPFGNDVDDDGRSVDPRGRPIEPEGYLLADGKIARDSARDSEYTRHLARRVVAGFHTQNVAMTTHVLAFAVFETLRKEAGGGDLYRFLRALGPETTMQMGQVEQVVSALLKEIRTLVDAGKIQASRVVGLWDAEAVVRRGLGTFATYHTTSVLIRRGIRLHVGDANLLYYYRNRLMNYGLMGTERLDG